MKCHIPGQNVKGRTIHALARFGDELFLEALKDCLLLRTINAAESAYAMIKFNTVFFSHYDHNYYTTTDDDGLKCKISMKSALHAFKSPAHMDKQVENLEIKLDPESCKLIFQLRCKYGIVKTHYVSILDCKVMEATYTKDLVPNRILAHHKTLIDALNSFQTSDDQITLEVNPQAFTLRNYIDNNNEVNKFIRTQISIKPIEFDNYTIGADTNVTFTLKEFRAMLTFSESLNLPLMIHFETTGRPVVFIVHNSTTFEANFVLATVKPDSPTQANTTQTTNDECRKRASNEKIHSTSKKVHLDDVANCLDEDSHLFDFIEIPNDKTVNGVTLTSNIVSTVFKRCLNTTIDTVMSQKVVLAENSDSE